MIVLFSWDTAYFAFNNKEMASSFIVPFSLNYFTFVLQNHFLREVGKCDLSDIFLLL